MRRVAVAAPLAIALGCGGTGTEAPACDAEAVMTCRVDQHGCTLVDGAPACVPCAVGTAVDARGRCAPIPGTPISHDFPENVSAPGEEILGICRSWTIGNDEELWVRAVELVQDEASHHSNWTFVPESVFPGPDGAWPCAERGYDEITAALQGGVLYAQSTQARHEVQLFPEGGAVRIPPRARLLSSVHVLNLGTETVRGHIRLTLYTVPRSDVAIPLAPIHFSYRALQIPPRAASRFQTTCAIGSDFQEWFGRPLDIRFFYALPHTHALGTRVFLEAVGGPRDGEVLFDVRGFNGEARGRGFDPPLDLRGIESIRFGCEFHNPRPDAIGWGTGDQEMCDFLGFVQSPGAFTSNIGTSEPAGTDGGMQVFEGECSTIVVPWEDRQGER